MKANRASTISTCRHKYSEFQSGYKLCRLCGDEQNKEVLKTKFKVGDRIKIINYGYRHWESKKERKRLFKLGQCNEKPANIIHEDKECYYIDSSPHLVGKEGIIAQVAVTSGFSKYDIWFLYKKSNIAWFCDEQLKKVNFFLSVWRLLMPKT